MKQSDPLVSVIMSVYNGRPYLKEAIQSILDHTFKDFEFVIVNDGLADGSTDVLKAMAAQDCRITVLHQENQGPAAGRNRALRHATGQYVAVMDADDISHPQRLDRQLRFLEASPDVGIVSTQTEFINAEGDVHSQRKWPLPTGPGLVEWDLLFRCTLCHSTVMMRHALLKDLNGYAEWAKQAQDHELWTRAVSETNLANLPDTLHQMRLHDASITATKRKTQYNVAEKAAASLHETLLGARAEEDFAHFLLWMHREDVQRAIGKTGVRNLASVHEYLRTLYWVYTRDVLPDGGNVKVRRAALPTLDTISDRIGEDQGWEAAFLHKLRARLMPPRLEILPWAIRTASERLLPT